MANRTPGRQRTASPRYQPDVHLNLRVRGLGHSATVAINERSNALIQTGCDIIKFGLGQSPFPVPDEVVEALRRHAAEKDYLPVQGLRELRHAVAEYHRREIGIHCTGEQVLIGPGSKELMFLLQLVFYGDLVIPTPSWVSYVPQARIIGREVRLLPTRHEDRWQLSAEQLDAFCREDPGRPRIVILNYPSNPTGGTYKLDDLKNLARVAREHRVVLLSDEIYGKLHHQGQHVSIARFYPEGTIVSNGLSKWCGAGGWRLGTFVFPEGMHWMLNAMATAASETYTSTSAPIQYAAITAFDGSPSIEEYLTQSRRVLRHLAAWIVERFEQAGIDGIPPTGAFYLFPDFAAHREKLARRGIETSAQLCEAILDEVGVAFLPGSVFGRDPRELTCRIAYVDFDGAHALEGARKTSRIAPQRAQFVKTYAPRIEDGVERIVQWLDAL